MKPEPKCVQRTIIEREEYEALMSGFPTRAEEMKPTSDCREIEEKFRRIEFCMMIIVGLVLVVYILCKGT
ncbi:MAG: hypothetical protein ACOZFS_04765 [Thermodesulfobacteriota bacterium]